MSSANFSQIHRALRHQYLSYGRAGLLLFAIAASSSPVLAIPVPVSGETEEADPRICEEICHEEARPEGIWRDMSLKTNRCFHTATLLDSGKILAAGGQNISQKGALSSVDLIDPSKGSVEEGPRMENPRSAHTATKLRDGRVLAVAGKNSSNTPLDTAELFDPKENKFSMLGPLASKRAHHSATRLDDGCVLVAGGTDGPMAAELFNPMDNSFTASGMPASGYVGHAAALLKNGKVLLTGGLDNPNAGKPSNLAELYDPATKRFIAAGMMQTARYHHCATLLPNGKVLLSGGYDENQTPLKSAEVFNPATGAFSLTQGEMKAARALHAATLLKCGRVLITGGAQEPFSEIYDPINNTFSNYSTTALRFAHTATLLRSDSICLTGGKRVSGNGPVNASIEFLAAPEIQPLPDPNPAPKPDPKPIPQPEEDKSQPIIKKFAAEPGKIKAGQRLHLIAEFQNGEGVIEPGFTPIESGKPLTVQPSITTTYTLTVASPANKHAQASVKVTVE